VLLGLALVSALVVPVGIIALGLLALRAPERAAFGGGAIVLTGSVFIYVVPSAVERCADFDRVSRPTGGCTVYGVDEQLIAMGLYLLVGIGLTAYASLRTRPLRA
jgi:hypothetical protein